MIHTSVQQQIALVTMAHGKVNAMSLEFLQELKTQLEAVVRNDQVHQVILAGNERVFSAGVDLKRLVAEGNEYLKRFLELISELFLYVFEFPKPLIAAVTGHAVAGGCVLACAADYRVISDRASIGVPELRVGVPFPSAGMEIMRWATQPAAFRAIINTGATFCGEAAVAAGLADKAVPPASLLDVARQATEPFAVVPAAVFQLTKRQMRLPVLDRIRRSEEVLGQEIHRLWQDDATRRVVTEYVQRRLS